MPSSSPVSPGTAVVVFAPPMLHHVTETLRSVGFQVEAFEDMSDAATYILRSDSRVNVLVANASLPDVMNGEDLSSKLAQMYPSLPIVLADHYQGRVLPNVMCMDKPWTLEHVGGEVLAMVAKLPGGKGRKPV